MPLSVGPDPTTPIKARKRQWISRRSSLLVGRLELSELSRFINAFSLRLPELLEAKTDMVVVFQVETQPLAVLWGKGGGTMSVA